MRSEPAVLSVRGLSKCYRIASCRERPTTLAEATLQALRRSFRRERSETLWALRDVSFEVQRGDVVGMIGRNGAGKSTLLKILSRITSPTKGEVDLRGRVGSLLEVGTGFHKELTGRENIFLNGSILGLRRCEIARRFDEIVDFAGIHRYLDVPVKRYSSGMAVRLAFAVAAHLEPEILIVDEVLAVGDAEFQRRCLGKMRSVAGSGRTVLFVSHDLAAVKALCTRALVLHEGRLVDAGAPESCIQRYLDQFGGSRTAPHRTFASPPGAKARMLEARILVAGQTTGQLPMGEELAIEVDFEADEPMRPAFGLVVSDARGTRVLHVSSRYAPAEELKQPRRAGTIRCELGAVPLTPDHYSVALYLGDAREDHHVEQHGVGFEVRPRALPGSARAYESRHSLLWWPASLTVREDVLLERSLS